MVMDVQLVTRPIPKDSVYLLLEIYTNEDRDKVKVINVFDDCANAIFALDEKRKYPSRGGICI